MTSSVSNIGTYVGYRGEIFALALGIMAGSVVSYALVFPVSVSDDVWGYKRNSNPYTFRLS